MILVKKKKFQGFPLQQNSFLVLIFLRYLVYTFLYTTGNIDQ